MQFRRVPVAALAAVMTMAVAGADGGGTVYTGFVAGFTQFVSTGGPAETAEHLHETGGTGECARNVEFRYNGGVSDVAIGFVPRMERQYLTRLYLQVRDAQDRVISRGSWDDSSSSGLGLVELLPVIEQSERVVGECGQWTFTVWAHRGASPYEITIDLGRSLRRTTS